MTWNQNQMIEKFRANAIFAEKKIIYLVDIVNQLSLIYAMLVNYLSKMKTINCPMYDSFQFQY